MIFTGSLFSTSAPLEILVPPVVLVEVVAVVVFVGLAGVVAPVEVVVPLLGVVVAAVFGLGGLVVVVGAGVVVVVASTLGNPVFAGLLPFSAAITPRPTTRSTAALSMTQCVSVNLERGEVLVSVLLVRSGMVGKSVRKT